jgi:hypothetical protein
VTGRVTLPRVPGTRSTSPLVWSLFALTITLVALAGYAVFAADVGYRGGGDMDAYWNAALRLRAGQDLYLAGSAESTELYRYAPWFAYLWIPLTYLPQEVVRLGWSLLLLAAVVACTVPLLRQGMVGLVAAIFFFPISLQGMAYGNVQPLIVAALLFGTRTRAGPLFVALAASLKVVPILFVLVDLRRGEWRRALLTLGITALLVAPMLAHDLSGYSTAVGPRQISIAQVWPGLWLAVAVIAAGATVWLGRTRYAWLAAGLAMVLALPRLLTYELSFLLVGLAEEPRPQRRETAEQTAS